VYVCPAPGHPTIQNAQGTDIPYGQDSTASTMPQGHDAKASTPPALTGHSPGANPRIQDATARAAACRSQPCNTQSKRHATASGCSLRALPLHDAQRSQGPRTETRPQHSARQAHGAKPGRSAPLRCKARATASTNQAMWSHRPHAVSLPLPRPWPPPRGPGFARAAPPSLRSARRGPLAAR